MDLDTLAIRHLLLVGLLTIYSVASYPLLIEDSTLAAWRIIFFVFFVLVVACGLVSIGCGLRWHKLPGLKALSTVLYVVMWLLELGIVVKRGVIAAAVRDFTLYSITRSLSLAAVIFSEYRLVNQSEVSHVDQAMV